MNQIVNFQESNLLRELQSLESASEAEVQSQLEQVQFAISVTETSLEKVSENPPSDVRRAAKDVHDTTLEMLQSLVISDQYHAPSYKFISVNIDKLLSDDQNFIGHIEVESPAGKRVNLKRVTHAKLKLVTTTAGKWLRKN